jgi:peptidoglycan biosynthesis protein MviN/MurJ (putative lipid II flippase)
VIAQYLSGIIPLLQILFIILRKWKIFLALALLAAFSSLIWYFAYYGLNKLYIEEMYWGLIFVPGTLLQILILGVLLYRRHHFGRAQKHPGNS